MHGMEVGPLDLVQSVSRQLDSCHKTVVRHPDADTDMGDIDHEKVNALQLPGQQVNGVGGMVSALECRLTTVLWQRSHCRWFR